MIAGLVPLMKSYNVLVFYFVGETDLQKHTAFSTRKIDQLCGLFTAAVRSAGSQGLSQGKANDVRLKHHECVSVPVCERASPQVCGC